MSNPKYIATQNQVDVLTGIFSQPEGQLWELDVYKSYIIYKPVAKGSLLEIAKLADGLNSHDEAEADVKVEEGPAIKYETVSAESELIVGEPTVAESARQAPSMRPGWEPLWILQELNNSLSLVNEGKINLVAFKNRIAKIEEQMMEDIPK